MGDVLDQVTPKPVDSVQKERAVGRAWNLSVFNGPHFPDLVHTQEHGNKAAQMEALTVS